MLSYLHSFHAGNFADVLKHSISVHILNYLTQKPKGLFYLDTHAGAGGFSLKNTEAQKNQEYENGIGKLWHLKDAQKLPRLLKSYLDCIVKFNPGKDLTHYPGSPWFAQELLREHDRASLFELHPREFKILCKNFEGDRRLKPFQSDGFHACLSQLPPKEKRGYILMDPPYEVKQDYKTAVESLVAAHKKFATGTYALWFPVVDRYRINDMEKAFIKSGVRNIQLFEFGIEKDGEPGMTSSGMIVINPPWDLKAAVDEALPFLAQQLAPKTAHYRSLQLVAE